MDLYVYEEREEFITVYVYVVLQEGNTALILAVDEGHTFIAEMLLNRGAKINHKNKVRYRGGGHGPVRTKQSMSL